MASVAISSDRLQASFETLERQNALIASCTLLWKELSDHFFSLEQDLQRKSDSLNKKFRTLEEKTKETLDFLEKREATIDESVATEISKVEQRKVATLDAIGKTETSNMDSLSTLRSFCKTMNFEEFWIFVTSRKKDIDVLRSQIPIALSDCIDPAKFVLEAIPTLNQKTVKSDRVSDFGWARILILESLIPVLADPLLGASRPLVTPSIKKRAQEIVDAWKENFDQNGGIENVKAPEVHAFLQHVVTFGLVSKEDADLYRKFVVGFARRKQMPKLAISLGLADIMSDIIEELIKKGEQVDAVHFAYEAGLVDKYPPVPLLKAYLKDSKKAATCNPEDRNTSAQGSNMGGRKEQLALRAVIKCIEDHKLEAEFHPESLHKRLGQLEKIKNEKKRSVPGPANKRTRASNGGPMPPAKAGRLNNAFVSSFPATTAYVRSPAHSPQYSTGAPAYGYDRSPPHVMYAYPPEEMHPAASIGGSFSSSPVNFPAFGGYCTGLITGYQQAYYR